MAGNLNSGMCSPLCSDVCAFYLPQGLTLALMGKHENGMCDECDVSETVEHVLFECSKYDDQRNSLFGNISNKPVSVVDLFGKGFE